MLPLAPLALLAALAATAAAASAQVGAQVGAPVSEAATANTELRYTVDAQASSVSAKVSFFGLSSKTARFPKMAGDVKIVPGQPEAARINVTFDATALEAPDSVTLSRLRGDRFFWVEKHPQVRFVGKSLNLTSARKGTVTGELTARGVTNPATLDVEFNKPPLQTPKGEAISFTGTTTIDRRAYEMTSYQLIVGNKVKITLTAKLQPS